MIPNLSFLSFEIHEPITHAAFRENIFGVGRILLKFLAKIIDVEAHIMRLIAIFVAPNFYKDLIVRNNPARILDEVI